MFVCLVSNQFTFILCKYIQPDSQSQKENKKKRIHSKILIVWDQSRRNANKLKKKTKIKMYTDDVHRKFLQFREIIFEVFHETTLFSVILQFEALSSDRFYLISNEITTVHETFVNDRLSCKLNEQYYMLCDNANQFISL